MKRMISLVLSLALLFSACPRALSESVHKDVDYAWFDPQAFIGIIPIGANIMRDSEAIAGEWNAREIYTFDEYSIVHDYTASLEPLRPSGNQGWWEVKVTLALTQFVYPDGSVDDHVGMFEPTVVTGFFRDGTLTVEFEGYDQDFLFWEDSGVQYAQGRAMPEGATVNRIDMGMTRKKTNSQSNTQAANLPNAPDIPHTYEQPAPGAPALSGEVTYDPSSGSRSVTVGPSLTSVTLGDVTVDFGSFTLTDNATLKVTPLSYGLDWTLGDALASISVTLDGAENTRFACPVEITMPCPQASAGMKVCATYFNEETLMWDPVLYAANDGKITILTDHFTEFGLFEYDPNDPNNLVYAAADSAFLEERLRAMEMSAERAQQIIANGVYEIETPSTDTLSVGLSTIDASTNLFEFWLSERMISYFIPRMRPGEPSYLPGYQAITKTVGRIGLSAVLLKAAYESFYKGNNTLAYETLKGGAWDILASQALVSAVSKASEWMSLQLAEYGAAKGTAIGATAAVGSAAASVVLCAVVFCWTYNNMSAALQEVQFFSDPVQYYQTRVAEGILEYIPFLYEVTHLRYAADESLENGEWYYEYKDYNSSFYTSKPAEYGLTFNNLYEYMNAVYLTYLGEPEKMVTLVRNAAQQYFRAFLDLDSDKLNELIEALARDYGTRYTNDEFDYVYNTIFSMTEYEKIYAADRFYHSGFYGKKLVVDDAFQALQKKIKYDLLHAYMTEVKRMQDELKQPITFMLDPPEEIGRETSACFVGEGIQDDESRAKWTFGENGRLTCSFGDYIRALAPLTVSVTRGDIQWTYTIPDVIEGGGTYIIPAETHDIRGVYACEAVCRDMNTGEPADILMAHFRIDLATDGFDIVVSPCFANGDYVEDYSVRLSYDESIGAYYGINTLGENENGGRNTLTCEYIVYISDDAQGATVYAECNEITTTGDGRRYHFAYQWSKGTLTNQRAFRAISPGEARARDSEVTVETSAPTLVPGGRPVGW